MKNEINFDEELGLVLCWFMPCSDKRWEGRDLRRELNSYDFNSGSDELVWALKLVPPKKSHFAFFMREKVEEHWFSKWPSSQFTVVLKRLKIGKMRLFAPFLQTMLSVTVSFIPSFSEHDRPFWKSFCKIYASPTTATTLIQRRCRYFLIQSRRRSFCVTFFHMAAQIS